MSPVKESLISALSYSLTAFAKHLPHSFAFSPSKISSGVPKYMVSRENARRAFATKEGKEALNAITHPEITRLTVEEIHKAQKNGAKAAVIDAALLFESCMTALCTKTVSVVADEKIRLERIMKRDNISVEDALLRMNAQPSAEYYKGKADIVIENNDNFLIPDLF